MPITLLGLAEISNTVRKHFWEIMSTRWILKHRLNPYGIWSEKSRKRNPVTLFVICMSMIEMSRLMLTLLMHWQIILLICLPLVSTQLHWRLYVTKLKSRILTFHLKLLRCTTGPFLWKSYRMLYIESMILQHGWDEIHYPLLKHLLKSSLLLLLNIFNKIWISHDFPSDWRKATIITIPKPGYLPIMLTSCICETMERMINCSFV